MKEFLIMPIFLKDKNLCFVKCMYDKKKLNIIPDIFGNNTNTWDRYKLTEAIEKDLQIIKCSECQEHAVVIDNYYPFNARNSLCQYHLEKKLKLLKKDKVAC